MNTNDERTIIKKAENWTEHYETGRGGMKILKAIEKLSWKYTRVNEEMWNNKE